MDRRVSSSFFGKKWLLFSLCLVVIIGQIVLANLASRLIDKSFDNQYNIGKNSQSEDIQVITDIKNIKEIKRLTILSCVSTIIFQLVGLLGAYKEHYGYTLTYAVYMNLGAIGSIYTLAVITPSLWWSTVSYFVACVSAWLFLHELRQIRLQLLSTPINLTVPNCQNSITVPTAPYIVAMSGPSTISNGQQYNQQYCSQPAGTYDNGQPQYGQQYGNPQTYGQPAGIWQSPPPSYSFDNQYCDKM